MKARSNLKYRFLLLPLLMLLVCVGAYAQNNSEITGTVTDKVGAVVPGAHVTVTERATGFTKAADTNDSGAFVFAGLNVGTYDMTVTAKGFGTSVSKGLVLNISQTLRADASLAV